MYFIPLGSSIIKTLNCVPSCKSESPLVQLNHCHLPLKLDLRRDVILHFNALMSCECASVCVKNEFFIYLMCARNQDFLM